MYDLVAAGMAPGDRWRKRLPQDVDVTIGRMTAPWDTPWDNQISRRHFIARLKGDRMVVQKIPEAANPIFFQGERKNVFEVRATEKFVIGSTTFWLVPNQYEVTQDVPAPIHMRTFSDDYLRKVNYRDVRGRLEILSELPMLISGAGTAVQLHDTLARLLMRGVLRAQSVALVSASSEKDNRVEVIHWDSRHELPGGFSPSEKLILEAIETRQTVLHVWRENSETIPMYTVQQNADWAFVCPLDSQTTRGQAIYVSGQSADPELFREDEQIQDDMKFVQVAGATYSSLSDLRELEKRQSSLRSFFSPVVVDALSGSDIDAVLEPREAELSILFCDMQGFSGKSEKMRNDLLELLAQVSHAMSVMTGAILDHRGVVGDFHGDAVMGFWGWPIKQDDAPLRASRTAISIARHFIPEGTQAVRSPQTSGLQSQVGMGIASGVAVAGKIGSADQVKVTAFGPVVNLAARLESLTRAFSVPVLCDETTARKLASCNDDLPNVRTRRLVKLLPAGFRIPVEVWQILLPDDLIGTRETEIWDQAVQLLEAGNWKAAYEGFKSLPEFDRAKYFVMNYVREQNFTPPADWSGAIPQRSK